MRPRTSINDLPTELITKIADHSTQQGSENLSLVNRNLFSKLGATFFSNSNEFSIGNYLAHRQNEMDEIYKKIISAASIGCNKYLEGYLPSGHGTCGDETEVRITKGTNRAFWFLNIFKECTVNFSLFALFSLLSEGNGKSLKEFVLLSIKNQLSENGLSEKQIPNIKRYLLNKFFQKEADLHNAKKTLIESIHSQQNGSKVHHFSVYNDYYSFHYLDLHARYDYVIKKVNQLQKYLTQNNFVASKKTCLIM